MSLILFVSGLLVGGLVAGALLGRRAAGLRREADALAAHARHQEELFEREQDAHARQVEELRRATEEKLALVTGNREALAQEMKAISAGVLQETTKQLTQLAEQARAADREIAAGELGKRTEEIKRTLSPIAEHLKKVEQAEEEFNLNDGIWVG
jgi:hypothetical protein